MRAEDPGDPCAVLVVLTVKPFTFRSKRSGYIAGVRERESSGIPIRLTA